MSAEQRSRLLSIAARRGEKGFSRVLGEAIDYYLRGEAERERRRQKALALEGTLGPKDAEELRSHARALRENWR